MTFIDFLFYSVAFSVVLGLVVLLLIAITALNVLQKYFLKELPEKLRTWEFLPLPMRSLQPYDKILNKIKCCKSKISATEFQMDDVSEVNKNEEVHKKLTNNEERFEVLKF